MRKTVDGVGTDYLHAGDMEIAEYDSDTGELLRRYIPGAGTDQRVAIVECGGSAHCEPGRGSVQTRFYLADRQGNVLAVQNENGQLHQQFFYTPFGVELVGDASGNPFRYTGRRFDPETGLYYYRARYYDPDLGRFLQVDPIGYEDQWNLYAYVGNNPLNFTDPTGEERFTVGISGKFTKLVGVRGGVSLSYDTESMEVGASITGGGSLGASAAGSVSFSVEASEVRGNTGSISVRTETSAGISGRVGPVDGGIGLRQQVEATASTADGFSIEGGQVEGYADNPFDLKVSENDQIMGGDRSAVGFEAGADIGVEATASVNISIPDTIEAVKDFFQDDE